MQRTDRQRPTPLNVDTATDKAVRFLCGVLVGGCVAVTALNGLEALPLLGVVAGAGGLFAVAFGDNFLERIIRLAGKL